MIDLHTWTTPNGFKPIIMLEETSIPHRITPVDISKGEQKSAAHLALNPNGKIPALVDDDPKVTVFESGAILIYLAEKSGRFLPREGQGRADVLGWLMFQMSAVGPMFGQWGRVHRAPSPDPTSVEYFDGEAARILGVLDGQLAKTTFLAGEYSIADMATYTWVSGITKYGMSLDRAPHVQRWVDAVAARPAVARAMAWKP